MWFIDFIANALPFYYVMKDSGIDHFDSDAFMTYIEARFPPPVKE